MRLPFVYSPIKCFWQSLNTRQQVEQSSTSKENDEEVADPSSLITCNPTGIRTYAWQRFCDYISHLSSGIACKNNSLLAPQGSPDELVQSQTLAVPGAKVILSTQTQPSLRPKRLNLIEVSKYRAEARARSSSHTATFIVIINTTKQNDPQHPTLISNQNCPVDRYSLQSKNIKSHVDAWLQYQGMKQRKKIKYVEKKPPDITEPHQDHPSPQEKPVKKDARVNQGWGQKEEYRGRQEREKPRYAEKEDRKGKGGKGDLSCIICSEEVGKRQSIWTCGCCCISLHLGCMREWIKKVNGIEDKRQHIYSWKCPQCNHQYCEPLPKYYCYCGKLLNPEYDPDLSPHSCGDVCDKKRGPLCPHLCPLQCHSGKCPPCNIQTNVATCQCGKTQRTLRCSEDPGAFQCGKKCEKTLNCGVHKCQRNCHPGPCQPCRKKKLAQCHCGNNSDVIDCSEESYSCGESCGRILNCGFHKCEMKCHSGPCHACPHTPELQTTCPCGKYSIEMLTGDPDYRKSCQDSIPVCGMPCGNKLECGHVCPNSCHEGPCPPCKVVVDQNCSCGLQNRKIACHLQHHSTFKCESVCKRKRSCGNHLCNEVCCPHRNSPFPEMHPCELTCSKPLSCGKHDCGEPCHLGLCKKCPVVYSQPQPCPCGNTSLRPPILCGTFTPECDNSCGKQLPCGHICSNLCHYGPCKCLEQVQIPCRCGRETISTTCGREALCLNKCQLKLPCGHLCGLQCHRGTCQEAHKEAPCRKHCNKERKNCGHICQQLCHPGQTCEDFPCEAQILVKCECGHRQAMTLCGAQDKLKTKKSIVCNKKCENLRRFDILYKDKQIYYPGAMVQFAFKNYPFLQHLEDRLERFILRSDQHFLEVEYKFPDNYTKLLLTDLFQNHYHLNTHFYRHHKYAAFTLMQGDYTMIPKPILSEYIKSISSGKIKQSNLPFQFTITFEVEQRDKGELILKSLSSFLHKYYSERNNKYLSLHFWSKEDGEHVLDQLQNEFQTIEFKCSYNISTPEQQVAQSDIIEVQQKEEKQLIEPQIEKKQTKEDKTEQETKKQIGQEEVKKEQKKEEKEKKLIPVTGDSSTLKQGKRIPKFQGAPKLIVRKNVHTYRKNDYPPSKENIQDIYLLDEEELFGAKVDWQQYIDSLYSKKMGPQATQWRIRTLLIINSFFPVPEKYFHELYDQLVKMYNKDKEAAMRILQIQRIDNKSVKAEMEDNGIYLSHHEPEILSYLRFYNYTAVEKIDVQYPEILVNTAEVTKSQEIIEAIQTRNFRSFYEHFRNCDFVFSCSLIPIVHCLREIVMEDIVKGDRIPTKDLYKYLLFNSQEELEAFFKQNGIEVSTRLSKTTKEDIYTLKSGQLLKETVENSTFVKEIIQEKRSQKYFLLQPEELYQEKYLILSFFAFGDFKESIGHSYMTALVKLLKSHQ